MARQLIFGAVSSLLILTAAHSFATEDRKLPDTVSEAAALIPANAALRLVGKIPMPQMTGTWDHLASDAKTARLFLSAQDQHAVDVVDLRTMKPVHRIVGIFNRPQGELYVPELDRLVISNGRDGTTRILQGSTYELIKTIQLSVGADMMEYDPRTKYLYVESGGTDSKRGLGKVTIINLVNGELVDNIETGFRAAAMVMERLRSRLYVAIPATNQIAVIDTNGPQILTKFDLPGRPASLALDEANHRLFVTTRTLADDPRPPTFNILDTETGKTLSSLESKDGTESMFFDAVHHRVYTSGLEGFVQAYQRTDANHYQLVATIRTANEAGTSQFIPELNVLCVPLPPHENQHAEVWVFEALQ